MRYWATSIAKSIGIVVPVFGDPIVDQTGPIQPANALISLIFGAQTNDAATIANKVTVGLYYETQLVAHNVAFTPASAHNALASVTFDPSTVLTAEASINAFIATAPLAAAAVPLVGVSDATLMLM